MDSQEDCERALNMITAPDGTVVLTREELKIELEKYKQACQELVKLMK